jgi:hypothetical protein
MKIRTVLQSSIVVAVIGSAALAQASLVWQCDPTTIVNCTCNPDPCQPNDPNSPYSPCTCSDPQCTSSPGVPYCHWVEQPTTPVRVYQEVNVLNYHHQYRTDMLGGLPFWTPQGSGFSLANDSAYGAVSFGLTSGSGYCFRSQTAIPNLVPLYYYTNRATGDYVYTVDWNYGHSLPCPSPLTGNCYTPAGFCGTYGVICYVGR